MYERGPLMCGSTTSATPTRAYCWRPVCRSMSSGARLGHESIKTTVDTYGHVLPASEANATLERALAFAEPVSGQKAGAVSVSGPVPFHEGQDPVVDSAAQRPPRV